MRAHEFLNEASFGVQPRRPSRAGSRPARGNSSPEEDPRFSPEDDIDEPPIHQNFVTEPEDLTRNIDLDKLKIWLDKSMDELSSIQRNIIKLHFFQNMDYDEIAQHYNLGRDRIIGLERRGLNILRNRIHSDADYKKQVGDMYEEVCACQGNLSEAGKASRELCISRKPDDELGASNLASCKSQGLRARDGNKSHLLGHGSSKHRVKVGGKKIKGKKYGGPLPDYGTRKGQ